MSNFDSYATIRLDIDAAHLQGTVQRVKEADIEICFVALSAERIPEQRAQARDNVARKRALEDEKRKLTSRLKAIKDELEVLDAQILQDGDALNHEPPTGNFTFRGARMASMTLRAEWLEDGDGQPIVETYRDIRKDTILELDNLRQQAFPFAEGDAPADEALEGSQETQDDASAAEDDHPFAEAPKRTRKAKGDPNSSLN